MNIQELLVNQALKAGLKPDNEKVKALQANDALKGIEVDAEITSAISSSLMSLDSAKTNPELKKHFYGTALGTIEGKIPEYLTELGYTADDFEELKTMTSTYDKLPAMLKKVQALEKKKIESASGDKSKLLEINNALNAEILKIKAETETILKNERATNANTMRDFHFQTEVSGMNLSKTIPGSLKEKAQYAMMTLGNKINELGGNIILKEGRLQLVSKEDPSLPFKIDHSDVDFNTWSKKTLNDLGYLDVSGTPPPVPPFTPPGGGGSGGGGNQSLDLVNKYTEMAKSAM